MKLDISNYIVNNSSDSITLPDTTGNCNIDVSDTDANRTIDITTIISSPPDYIKNLQLTVKRTGRSINLLTWTEI